MTVDAIETKRNKEVKRMYDGMRQLLYVAWPSVSVRDILWVNGEQ